jgi:RNA 3'-terminal phosphate cyclase-like protein
MICLAPFAKDPVELTLNGITNDDTDLSVDLIRTVTLMNLKKFGIDNMDLKVDIFIS